MGTNYYARNSKGEIHIGKSSGGWVFHLRIHPELGINSLADYQLKIFGTDEIFDEYDRRISRTEMMTIILNRSWKGEQNRDPLLLKQNFAVPGPNGLLRSIYDPHHCIRWGDNHDFNATWDCFAHDFS